MGNAKSCFPSPKPKNQSTSELSSESRIDTTMGSHQFTINNYSLNKGRGIGEKTTSRRFYVGMHGWVIWCYLDGIDSESSGHISVFIQHYPTSKNKKARANFSLSLLDCNTGIPTHKLDAKSIIIFRSGSSNWGWDRFIERGAFEKSACLRGDSLTIICNITVIDEPKTYSSRVPVTVKSSNLRKQLGNLLTVEKGADIHFDVGDQTFLAHRCVLAATSPVFTALFSSQMQDAKDPRIKISDIEAPVFEAILLYIYTDDLPEIEIMTETGMAQHILVAADRFGLDKLRISCEKKLCEGLGKKNVFTALALAEQHNLCNLKSACLNFLSTHEVFKSATATDRLIHLIRSCPSIAKEISNKMKITKEKMN